MKTLNKDKSSHRALEIMRRENAVREEALEEERRETATFAQEGVSKPREYSLDLRTQIQQS